MGVGAIVPVQEALHIHHVAHIQSANGSIDLAVGASQVSFHAEISGQLANGEGNIDIVTRLAVLVLDLFNGQALDGNQLVLVVNQVFLTQQLGHVHRLSNEAALNDFKGGIRNFNFASPLGLHALDQQLGAGNQLLCILFGAGHVVDEVSAVFALSVNGNLTIPPGLMCLDIGLNVHFAVQLGSDVLCVSHGLCGSFRRSFGGSLGRCFGGSLRGSFGRCFGGSLGHHLGCRLCGSLGCLFAVSGRRAGSQGQNHAQSQQDCQKLFHVHSP